MHLFCFTWTFITIIENNFYYLHLDNGDIDKNSIKFIYLGWVILNRLLLYVLSLSIFTGITFSYSYDRYARQMLVLSLLSAQQFDCSLHNCSNEVDLETTNILYNLWGALKQGPYTCSTSKAFNLTYLHVLRL